MLTALSIRDVVLVEALDLDLDPGLTVLTGETGAGKSIILDALGMALGARGDAGLVRSGAKQAQATAEFAGPFPPDLIEALDEGGFTVEPGEPLILRRAISADGRSRAWVNDQPAGVTALRDLGRRLVEVHGQHETIGLLDPRTHRGMLDAYGGLAAEVSAVRSGHERLRVAEGELQALTARAAEAALRRDELSADLEELDRLDPREGEEEALAGERAILGAAEKALADLSQARDLLGGDALSQKLAAAFRAVDHARQKAVQSGAEPDHPVIQRLTTAAEAVDRALVEATEAVAAVDQAADAFDFDPGRLDKAEERLFALRAAARRLNVAVETLPAARRRIADQLRLIEDGEQALKDARADVEAARAHYDEAAALLSRARAGGAARLAIAVEGELAPLKLERARFRVALEPIEGRRGPDGAETVRFQVATNPGAPFGPIDAIASGGELARFALALKAALAGREGSSPVMIFDEVDQGVGGAVAEAVGLRLARLADTAQVLVVTHSPQVAAKGRSHWKVLKAEDAGAMRTAVAVLDDTPRLEEIARMLAGAEVTDAARAAAKALIG
ncbi:DNA repair protein RecN [Brevundimonas lutea]|uniref:DNA repair protein RecN n=1 Tax=Brevundimonas lutea TaxID=2293980 RepID=UPI000F02DAF2|nr:DNA repair protein RecN [Brevundimonas lutea]